VLQFADITTRLKTLFVGSQEPVPEPVPSGDGTSLERSIEETGYPRDV
jgi:hypothetical protein